MAIARDVTDVMTRFYASGSWKDFIAQSKLAWPTSLSLLFHYMIQPISLAFCGHLGKLELASAAMAISVIYILMVSVGRGLAYGADTFFSQTYGSSNKKNVGVYLQKGLIFGALWSLPVIALLLNTETLLLLIGQEQQVASMAQQFTQYFLPGVPAYCWLFMIMRYLLCQSRVLAILMICVTSCAASALLNYALVIQADMGINGSAIAMMMTYYLVLIQLVCYIWGSGLYRETWDGWSFECLKKWGKFTKVTTYSISLTLVWWLCTEIGVFLGGLLSTEELGAFSISCQVLSLSWMISDGIGAASATRIGQFLGANQPLRAKTATRVALTVILVVSVILAGCLYALKFYIPWLFTENQEVAQLTSSILQITVVYMLFEGPGAVLIAIMRGVGRQAFGTVVVIGNVVVAWSIGIPLMFATALGVHGLWWGFVAGALVHDLSIGVFIARIQWDYEASKAQVRAGSTKNSPNIDACFHKLSEQTCTEVNLTLTVDKSINGKTITETTAVDDDVMVWRTLLLRRLLACLLPVAMFAAGVFARLYVIIDPK